MTPAVLLSRYSRVAFDSNLFIYLFEANRDHGPAVRALFREAELAGTRVIASTIVVGETAAGPAHAGDEAMADRYADAIRSIPFVDLVPVSAEVAVDAAVLSGRRGIAFVDAIHLATARQAGASALITNDRRLPSIPNVEVIVLDDLDLDEPAYDPAGDPAAP